MALLQVLVVDDEPGMLEVFVETLESIPDVTISVEQSSKRALERLKNEQFDLLVTDIRMPEVDGVELLRAGREADPSLPALILTAYPTVKTAVETMKLGAADYITKPFRPEDLLTSAKRLLDDRRLREENRLLERQVDRRSSFDELVGKSEVMRNLYDTIEHIAPTDVDVLICGETGTGKELVARSIHRRSPRIDKRFVPVDCGAIPENLMEAELFGHERGAFTGAEARSMGLLEFAHRGTFFFDELAELPARLQSKLLRVLQERKIRRVGGKQAIDIDLRIIAATNRDLAVETREKRFREDLYYRINVATIELPALRDRAEDIPLLVTHFVDREAPRMGKRGMEVSPEFLEMLSRYSWPGNVRELQNVVKRALAMSRTDTLSVDDLPDVVVMDHGKSDGEADGYFVQRDRHLAKFERSYLDQLMRKWHGDATAAARDANLPRGTLYRLLKRHDISPADYR